MYCRLNIWPGDYLEETGWKWIADNQFVEYFQVPCNNNEWHNLKVTATVTGKTSVRLCGTLFDGTDFMLSYTAKDVETLKKHLSTRMLREAFHAMSEAGIEPPFENERRE